MREYYLIYLGVVNMLALMMYGLDKYFAVHHVYRISEKKLLSMAILGGCFGSLIGMVLFHHKVRKGKFMFIVPVCCVVYAFVSYKLL